MLADRMHDDLVVANSKGRIDGALLLLILNHFATAKRDVGDALRSRAWDYSMFATWPEYSGVGRRSVPNSPQSRGSTLW
jgi:hypothetical protein